MLNFPCSTEGIPLFELIGKEVGVTYVTEKNRLILKQIMILSVYLVIGNLRYFGILSIFL